MSDDESKLIFNTSEWSPELIEKIYVEIERIATEKYQLDCFPNQIEIISSEQMLDAYSSIGMPIMYQHWSFGKSFLQNYNKYKKGYMGLAYEIVINSSPCIAYCMEDNSMTMQALVIAHASFGHNSFFKNNYLFKSWTNPESIIDYIAYAKRYIAKCEERYGEDEVESLLDACHALQAYGVDRYQRPPELSVEDEEKKMQEREEYYRSQMDIIWNTIPDNRTESGTIEAPRFPADPHENVLLFIEENAPVMEGWKREVIRIVRKMAQYFYPQKQTSLMNEGWATFTHYNIMNDLLDEGLISNGSFQEFLVSHTGVVYQPGYDDRRFSGLNVYALGFAMFKDIKRICMEPTEEDIKWFPEWAGNGEWLSTCKDAVENFKDESFVLQFLSPKVIRDFKLFILEDDDREDEREITAIHNERGYQDVREALADNFRLSSNEPQLQVYDVDRAGTRKLTLQHITHERKPLEHEETALVLKHLRYLWGFDVELESIDPIKNEKICKYLITEDEEVLDIYVSE